MKVKTSELEGKPLDWAVAQIDPMCEGFEWRQVAEGLAWAGYGMIDGELTPCTYLSHGASISEKVRMIRKEVQPYSPSTNWEQGGPLIDKHIVATSSYQGGGKFDAVSREPVMYRMEGPTYLIAAMRAIVRAKIGEEVDLPDELAAPAAS